MNSSQSVLTALFGWSSFSKPVLADENYYRSTGVQEPCLLVDPCYDCSQSDGPNEDELAGAILGTGEVVFKGVGGGVFAHCPILFFARGREVSQPRHWTTRAKEMFYLGFKQDENCYEGWWNPRTKLGKFYQIIEG